MNKKSPLLWLSILLAGIAIVTSFGPPEKSLGTNVRIVYLHGAWVWTALLAFIGAAGAGLAGLVFNRPRFHSWSRVLGRTGLVFWITYLPLSLWAMQANWNGLFLAEPRWRIAVVFAVGGLLLQAGISLLESAVWASGANLIYGAGLFYALNRAEKVMHPPSPILDSEALKIQIFFGVLIVLVVLAAWQVARWWIRFEPI